MAYRYNAVDIIVGVGMCAIMFGAVLFFVAANGILQASVPQPAPIEQPAGIQFGMTLLQPVIGQAVVDHAIFERRANHAMAQSASEWNRATLAQYEFQSLSGGPLGAVMRQAAIGPVDHMARVQSVLGRAIVSFTRRGVRSGVLSAEDGDSPYNVSMIRMTNARGERLHRDFASTWQSILGRGIVDAAQSSIKRAGSIQEQLGTAFLHVAQAQSMLDKGWAAAQERLASLVVAAVRTDAQLERVALLAAIESFPEDTAVVSSEPASWPEIPIGFLIAAGLVLATIFFGGLSWSAKSRETKVLAEMRRDAARWVYRMAA